MLFFYSNHDSRTNSANLLYHIVSKKGIPLSLKAKIAFYNNVHFKQNVPSRRTKAENQAQNQTKYMLYNMFTYK